MLRNARTVKIGRPNFFCASPFSGVHMRGHPPIEAFPARPPTWMTEPPTHLSGPSEQFRMDPQTDAADKQTSGDEETQC